MSFSAKEKYFLNLVFGLAEGIVGAFAGMRYQGQFRAVEFDQRVRNNSQTASTQQQRVAGLLTAQRHITFNAEFTDNVQTIG